MEYQDTEEFPIMKLRKYIEGYVYDTDLSSSECLKVIVEIVRAYPNRGTENVIDS